jgi:hypothetical protein
MTKFNIQFTVNNNIKYVQSFKDIDTSELTPEEISELCQNLFKKIVNRLEEKNSVKKITTIIKPTSIKMFIENKPIKIHKFIDALLEVFKYLVDNNYINNEHNELKHNKKSKHYIFSDHNWLVKDNEKYRVQEYKGYYIFTNLSRWRIYLNASYLIKYFKLNKKIKIYNWPK